MSKRNNKYIVIEKNVKIEGEISSIIEQATFEMTEFLQNFLQFQKKEIRELSFMGFGFYRNQGDPENYYIVSIHLQIHNMYKEFFNDREEYKDITIRISDLPNDFIKIEEDKNESE